jgi:LPXTG-site transpeptidase (sortase) family protein
VAIAIPSIQVHSSLQKLGLNPDGTVQTPQPGPHYDEAGWFTGSATPGQFGVSVILGHIDSAANGPSVFFRLGAVKPGDQVIVDRADGSRATFTVDGVKEFPKSNFPTVQVYRGDPDTAGLRLITCGGPFDRSTRNYLDNIVVFAHLTGSAT